MKKNIEIIEFNWYLRDFFFRSAAHIKDSKTYLKCNNSDIAKNIKNKYLRYKEWELTKIEEFLIITLTDLGAKGAVELDVQLGQTKIISEFERKQCSDCFFVNILSLIEPRRCLRCNSEELIDFPIKKFQKKAGSM